MAAPRLIRFFLEPDLRRSAGEGRHNFIAKTVSVLAENGFAVEFHGNDARSLKLALADDGALAMFHMEHPVGPRALVFRRVYHYPFWAIEPSAERWNWHVARSNFDPGQVDPDRAAGFARFWRKRLFGLAHPPSTSEGFLYIPLQGRLTEQRSFQSCAPMQMIRHVLTHDPRPVIAALHPNEVYTPADHRALQALADAFPRLSVVTGQMDRLLPACDAVITQNSSVAFNGYFLGKPALLFGQSDFHHIALNAGADPAAALAALGGHRPDYDRYLFWFWQIMAINAGHEGAAAAIHRSLRRAGWL